MNFDVSISEIVSFSQILFLRPINLNQLLTQYIEKAGIYSFVKNIKCNGTPIIISLLHGDP